MDFLTLSQFLDVRPKGTKTAFLLRHAERNHITPQDADYGAHVRITENGKIAAYSAGTLFPLGESANYISSPVMRCRETASQIAKGRGDSKFDLPEKIPFDNRLGEFFVKDYAEYTKSLDEGFYESIHKYLIEGIHPAYKDLDKGSLEMLELIKEYSTADCNFVLTHDAWIVPCLKYFCAMDFTPQKWMNFLTGIAFVFDKDSFKAYPITLMDSGYLYF